MTLKQLNSFDEQELDLILYVVNILNPPGVPKMEFEPHHLKWFKTDVLIPKLIAIFPKLKPEGHPIYLSLMEKLGVKGEIKYEQPPVPMPITASAEATGSIPLTGSNQVTGSNF